MGNTCRTGFSNDASTEINVSSFQSYIQQKNKTVPQVGHIRLLSYNIFIRPPMITNNGDDFKDERLKQFTMLFKHYDIICLQEMFGSYSSRRATFIEKAREAGFLFSAVSPKPIILSSHFIDGGLLILSRYPIMAAEFQPYPEGFGADYYVNKGVLYVKIKIGSSYLHLYNTHAQATYDKTPKYFLKRMEQFSCFQRFIKQSLIKYEYCEQDLVLLTGDFNVNGRETQKFFNDDALIAPFLQGFPKLLKSPSFTEYDGLISCLTNDFEDQIEDLLLDKYGEHPITFGDFYLTENKERTPKDKLLTHKECFCSDERLDYIFKYIPKMITSDNIESPNLMLSSLVKQKLIAREHSAVVEKFFVHGHDFDQLSDHYGIKIVLECIQKNESDKSTNTDYTSP